MGIRVEDLFLHFLSFKVEAGAVMEQEKGNFGEPIYFEDTSSSRSCAFLILCST